MKRTREPGQEKGPVATLFLERALARSERRAMSERLIRWYVEELNALGDRLRFQSSNAAAAPGGAGEVRDRVRNLLQSLRWNERTVKDVVWKLATKPPEMPEDAFAPGVILFTLEADRARLASWISTLSEEAKEALRAWDPEIERLA